MDDWIGIVVAVGAGLPLLAAAVLVDLRRRRAEQAELAEPPHRGDGEVDALVPDYISQDTVDALPSPGAGRRAQDESPGGARLPFGHVDDDFATAGRVAELRCARVLMVDDPISSMRQVLVPLGDAAAGHPLVIAAASFHADVLAALKANRRVTHLPVVAVEANLAELMQLQDQVGGHILDAADLRAGWIPADSVGFAARWTSDASSLRVLGGDRGEG